MLLETCIEKNIFQCAAKKVDWYLRPFIKKWKKQKGFSYRMYYDEEIFVFVKEKYPDFFSHFMLLKGVEKADVFRLMVVYEYGGFYSDIDTAPRKKAMDLLNKFPNASMIAGSDAHFSSEEQMRSFGVTRMNSICNWTFAAQKRHPMIKKILELVMYNVIHHPELHVMNKTGPGAFTDAILGNPHIDGVLVLPIAYFGAGQRHSNSPSRSAGWINHYFIHSWWKKASLSRKIKLYLKGCFL